MNRKIILPAMMLVLTSMLATVIEATAKMKHNNVGVSEKCRLVPMAIASKAVISSDTTTRKQALQCHSSILNLNALKTINGIVKELPGDHSTSFQGTR